MQIEGSMLPPNGWFFGNLWPFPCGFMGHIGICVFGIFSWWSIASIWRKICTQKNVGNAPHWNFSKNLSVLVETDFPKIPNLLVLAVSGDFPHWLWDYLWLKTTEESFYGGAEGWGGWGDFGHGSSFLSKLQIAGTMDIVHALWKCSHSWNNKSTGREI